MASVHFRTSDSINFLLLFFSFHLETSVAEKSAKNSEHEVERADGGRDHVVVGRLEERRRKRAVLHRRKRRHDSREESGVRVFGVVVGCDAG